MVNTLAEIHFHTKETSTCGEVSVVESIPAYKNYGYDIVVITDHYNSDYFPPDESGIPWEEAIYKWQTGYRRAREIGAECGIDILLGMEIRFNDEPNDYLVYGMDTDFLINNPRLYKLNAESFSQLARKNHFFFAQAHPFRKYSIRCNPKFLDGVEVFNAHPHHNSQNNLALDFCNENSLIPICGSDYHQKEALRGCGMLFEGEVKDIKSLVDKLFSQKYKMIIPDIKG